MNPVSSNGGERTKESASPIDTNAVDSVMAVHRATFAKLIANELDKILLIDFFEDAAATYHLLAQQLRDAKRP